MFGELLESRPRKERRGTVTVGSAAAHAAAIVMAVVATATAESRPEVPPRPLGPIIFQRLPDPPEASEPPSQARHASGPAAPEPGRLPIPPGFPPVVISDWVPPINLGAPPPDGDLAPAGPAGSAPSASGVAGGAGRDGVHLAAQVERAAVALPGAEPRYPEMLRRGGVDGRVVVQFVVDTAGRVEPGSVRVVVSDHALFTDAVRAALPRLRFAPAEVGGRPVRQLVLMPFEFAIER